MTSLINLERDMLWQANVTSVAPASSDFNSGELDVVNDGVVGDRTSFVASTFGFGVTAGSVTNVFAFGCLILPPAEGDNTPYRVKGSAFSPVGNPIAWGFGYFEGTGSTLVQRCQLVSAGPVCDEILCARPLQSGDANFGEPLCFFGMVAAQTVDHCAASLSVQRLLSKPPQFATAVS